MENDISIQQVTSNKIDYTKNIFDFLLKTNKQKVKKYFGNSRFYRVKNNPDLMYLYDLLKICEQLKIEITFKNSKLIIKNHE